MTAIKEDVQFVVTVRMEYDTSEARKSAIECAKQSIHLEISSFGSHGYYTVKCIKQETRLQP
jgi:hypothetical protein